MSVWGSVLNQTVEYLEIPYPLCVQIRRTTLGIKEIAISSGIINAIQLPLPHEQICFPKRPRLGHGESVQLVPDFNQLVVRFLKPFVDLAMPVQLVSNRPRPPLCQLDLTSLRLSR